jgi:peptide/nickel transport system substrate-binding protein
MSDPEDTEHAPGEHSGLSRRTMLRLGMLAISATQLPAIPAGAQAPKPGAHLIGKLEGAEVVTDPAQVPKRFNEAPQLAELVKAGKLPPVEQRIGQDPLVVKPLREIGRYGGTWRRRFTGPFDTSNAHRAAQNDKLLYFDYTGTKIVPNIARGWEVSTSSRWAAHHQRRTSALEKST